MLRIALIALALAGTLRADEPSDFQPGDALYAPEEETPSAVPMAQGDDSMASYYSTARISAIDLGHDGRRLSGVNLFIDGQFVGKSPLDLSGYLVNKPSLRLSAQLDGYQDSEREALRIPPEGEAVIAMGGDNAASWYTTPSWVTGILLLGGAMAAYSQNSASSTALGNALIGGGIGVIVLSQAVARLIHLPRLYQKVATYNAGGGPTP